MTASPGDGELAAREGYYPDPSIPGFVRYWNGSAWVPGTSRPAPEGYRSQPPSPAPVPAPAPAPAPAAPAPAPVAVADETGPVFFDELDALDGLGALEGPGDPGRPAPPDDRDGPDVPAARDAAPQDAVPPGFRDPVSPVRIAKDRPAKDRPAQDRPAKEPLAQEAADEPAAWLADVSHQSGFGGDRDRKVSWGNAPASADAPSDASDAARIPAPAQEPVPAAKAPADTSAKAPAATPERSAAPAGILSVKSPAHTAPPARPPAESAAPAPAPAPEPAAADRLAKPAPADGSTPPATPWKPPSDELFQRLADEAPRPAGLGRRLGARLVDGLLTAAVGTAVTVPFVAKATEHIEAKIDAAKLAGETVTVWLLDGTTGGYLAVILAALLLFGFLYEVLPTARWGRTLGKKLFGVRVVRMETGGRPSFGAALGRWLVYGLLGAVGIGLLNILWCLVDRPWRQCWHDKAAGTFVAR
ncbi:RDD family protein [Streptomyces bambusae]|uniref:RDD family protein n=1 Tax=Streptomyces bambusae TaxID=1550616 RepID=UPI0027DF304B|nr:RDD family protein [Streptomyces bambusae]